MADVIPGGARDPSEAGEIRERRDGAPEEDDARAESRDRGQLILVTGLIIAVTFVALALTLNTVIYTENLATRSADIAGGDDAIRFLDVARDGVAGLVERANDQHNETREAAFRNVSGGIDAWRNTTGRSLAINGIVTNVSGVTITNGTRMQQTDTSRDFTSAGGAATWTLASDVSGTRQFRLNVTRASLTNSAKATVDVDTVFFVHFNDQSSSQWEVLIYKNLTGTNTVNVTVHEHDGLTLNEFGPCSATGEHAFVNITAGTVGGESCPALSFVSDLDAPYTITYNETEVGGVDTANGTYHLIVDNASVAESPGPQFNDAPGNSPWADAAVYAVEFDAVYETERLRYNASVRVAPGEADG